jgi:hypothetical protein
MSRALSFASCGLGKSSGWFRSSLPCGLCCVLHSPHYLPELFGLIFQQLSLPTDELSLDLSEFLWLFHTNKLLSNVERI